MQIKTGILIILVGALTIAIVADLVRFLIGEVPSCSLQTLPAPEVHDYQAELLSSLSDLQEFSRYGPQHVDL